MTLFSSRVIGAPVIHMRSIQQQWKTTDFVDVNTGHRVVIEFLSAEGYSPIKVRRGLRSVYREDVTDVSAARPWIHRLKGGENDICDRAHIGRKVKAATTETEEKVDAREVSSNLRAICADIKEL